MLKDNLFDRALIEPIRAGADTLYVVSGYATARMAVRHLTFAKSEFQKNIHIHLIVGMALDGLEKVNHAEFLKLEQGYYGSDIQFECHYVITPPRVHSKTYAWFKAGEPVEGFIGSANYTQSGFSKSIREVLTKIDAEKALHYYRWISADTISCQSSEVESTIPLYTSMEFRRRVELAEAGISSLGESDSTNMKTLSFLDRVTGEVPERSGLNWGQRPEHNRNPNEAYIHIPAAVQRSGFFPEIGVLFTLSTDDDKSLICVRAQANGKGLESPLSNRLLGEYFRNRLGLPNGAKITRRDLDRYGRTDVNIYKIDDENYRLDFSVTA
jgi:hypothetical protein